MKPLDAGPVDPDDWNDFEMWECLCRTQSAAVDAALRTEIVAQQGRED